jgi:hypothetical protein
MTDYFISNTFTFFANGEADILDLLEMVKRYDGPGHIGNQIRIINMIYTIDMSIEIEKYRRIADQYLAWKDLLSILNSWEEAWLAVVTANPTRAKFCCNETVINYTKLIS